MKVWIDQDICTGDGLCSEIVPDIFVINQDGLAYVKEVSWPNLFGPNAEKTPVYKGSTGMALVPESLQEKVVEAAEECPGECIFLELE